MTPTIDTDQAERLIKEFAAVDRKDPRPRTSMEIVGYPHWERVASNLLAFFMDPQEDHGLGHVVLEALVEAAGMAAGETSDWSSVEPQGEVSIETEVPTRRGRRIDLVVETAQAVIAIENKIFAAVYNDLDDYAKTAEGLAKKPFAGGSSGDVSESEDQPGPDPEDQNGGSRIAKNILLSLKPVAEKDLRGFTAVRYAMLIDHILGRIGRPALDANSRRLGLLFDFIRTIENLDRGSHMDTAFLDFMRDNRTDVQSLNKKVRTLQKEMRAKVKRVDGAIRIDDPERRLTDQGLWGDINHFFDRVYRGIQLTDALRMKVDLEIDLDGWNVSLFPVTGSKEELSDWLRARGVEVVPHPHDRHRDRLTLANHAGRERMFEYDEDDVAEKEFQGIVQRIVTAATGDPAVGA